MQTVDAVAFVRVSRTPRLALAVLCLAGALLCASAVISGVLQGNLYLLVGLLPLIALVGAVRRYSSNSEIVQRPVRVSCDEGGLVVEMRDARLMDRRYLDQRYATRRNSFDGAAAGSDGTLALRSRAWTSEALDGDACVDRNVLNMSEVSFRTDLDTQQRILEMLQAFEYPCVKLG